MRNQLFPNPFHMPCRREKQKSLWWQARERHMQILKQQQFLQADFPLVQGQLTSHLTSYVIELMQLIRTHRQLSAG